MSKIINEYFNFKTSYPDHIILYQLGSFYEIYFNDAINISNKLNIALKYKKIAGKEFPFCGFPYKSLDLFCTKLINLGFKLAIASQFIDEENPRNFQRQINKIITIDGLINLIEDQIIAAIAFDKNQCHLCFGNKLTGRFYFDVLDIKNNNFDNQINYYLEDINPEEILVNKEFISKNIDLINSRWRTKINIINYIYKIDNKVLNIIEKNSNLALKIILDYLILLYGREILSNLTFKPFYKEHFLQIDKITAKNLNLTKFTKNIDRTSSKMGKRFLKNSLLHPLTNYYEISNRSSVISFFIKNNQLANNLKFHLKEMPDLEKIITKSIFHKKITINNLYLILVFLDKINQISQILFWQINNQQTPSVLVKIYQQLFCDFNLFNSLKSLLMIDNKGNIDIKSDSNPLLDNLYRLKERILGKISYLQIKYQKQIMDRNLQIKFDIYLGFYIEIKKESLKKIRIPQNWCFIKNYDNCFHNKNLQNLYQKMLDIENKINLLKEEILYNLWLEIVPNINSLKYGCKAIALLDFLLSGAFLAKEQSLNKPVFILRNQKKISNVHPFYNEIIFRNISFNFLFQTRFYLELPEFIDDIKFTEEYFLILILAHIGYFIPETKLIRS